ncbi:hypothetical protein [Actinocrinis puniceicyclus]
MRRWARAASPGLIRLGSSTVRRVVPPGAVADRALTQSHRLQYVRRP